MNSQASPRESLLRRVVNESVPRRVVKRLYLGAFLLLIVSFLLRGIADKFGLQTLSYHITSAPSVLLFLVILIDGKERRGFVPTIALLVGGVFLMFFSIFPRWWLLVPGLVVLAVGAIFVVWPQLRNVSHRLSNSYREMSASSKV